MSANKSSNTVNDTLLNEVKRLSNELELLKTNQLKVFVIPKVSSDPATLVNGQMWYNTTSNELKLYRNGTTRIVTTS